MSVQDSNNIRENISQTYTHAIKTTGSCCGPEKSAAGWAQGGSCGAAYDKSDLEGLPEDLKGSSFGCGNPLAFSGVQPGDVVLDLGSGAGLDLLVAARKVGPEGRVIGVDMTDAMIERAQQNIDRAGVKNVEVRKGLIEELPVESNSVDWVISNCVINLSPEKSRVFKEIHRVLKPGGQLAVSDIVAEGLPDWVANNAAAVSACVGGAISEQDYLQGLRDAGLSDVAVKERLVYDKDQLLGLAESPEFDEIRAQLSCCGAEAADKIVGQLAETVTGKVWSAKFHARKPS